MSGLLDHVSVKFGLSLAFRLANAFLNSTFFQPDEFYQAWEPAYADVYGVGFRSWEWQAGIRTSLMPRLFTSIIRASRVLSMDHLTLGKIFMAFTAAIADVATSLLAKRMFPENSQASIEQLAWLVSLGSMFNWYCSTRPFSNTIEMVLVVCALNLWQCKNLGKLLIAQVLAHIAIALRPSVGLFWLLMGLDLLRNARTWTFRFRVGILSILVAVAAQGFIILLDESYYRGLAERSGISPPNAPAIFEFLRHNFGSRVSEIYGVLPWHWYVSQGIPFLLLGYLPFVPSGWSRTPKKWRILIVVNVLAFSRIAHKEFRFIYFLLPLMHIMVAQGLLKNRKNRWLAVLAVVVNSLAAFYFSLFHQRGVIDVVKYIRRNTKVTNVSFIMPCHSTPWRAHFERLDLEFQPQFLTCDPPWNRTSVGYVDEADQFYMDPEGFLDEHPEKLTETVVIFEPLLPLLRRLGYTEQVSFSNGLFNDDSRRNGKVYLLKRDTARFWETNALR